MPKKKFIIPEDIASNFDRTLSMAERNLSLERHQLIPIDLIEFDPNNPRQLSISREDVLNGISEADELYDKKLYEYNEILKPLAETITKIGVISPIQVFKKHDKYNLIHGECRCLASLIANKNEIKAFVCQKEPNEYEIKFLQLVENVFRKDLSLYEKLKNIESVYNQYKNHIDEQAILNTSFVQNIICCSERQARKISSVLNAPKVIMDLIKNRKIKDLNVAARISSTKDVSLKEKLITEAENGISIRKTKRIIKIKEPLSITTSKKAGRKATRINLGYVKNKNVIKRIYELMLSNEEYRIFKDDFNEINWKNFDDCTKAFKKIIKIIDHAETSNNMPQD
jgi:ParB/RepB/Spo0J family partition protein